MVETSVLVAYVVAVAVLIGLVVFMIIRGKRNRDAAIAEAMKEVVAGADSIEGQSETMPEKFQEPDDDAMDEMEKLLEDAAPDEV